MFDFKELEAFVWIVRLNSFRMAASHLSLTQPSISDRINRLEARLGHTLLERHRRPVRPTRKGQEFFVYSEQLLSIRQQALMAMQSPNLYHGKIRLGIVESLAQEWLIAFIRTCKSMYSKLVIEVELDVTPRVQERLLNHDIDLAFMVGPVEDEHLVSRFLCHYPTRLIAAKSLLNDLPIDSAKDLEGIGFITPTRQSSIYQSVKNFMSDHDLGHAPLHGSSSLSMIIQMVKEGMGIGALPESMLHESVKNGDVIILPFDLPGLEFYACRYDRVDNDLVQQLMSLALSIAQRHHS